MIEMPSLESCPFCFRAMVGEKAYYTITDNLCCLRCMLARNSKFIVWAEIGAITKNMGNWKKSSGDGQAEC